MFACARIRWYVARTRASGPVGAPGVVCSALLARLPLPDPGKPDLRSPVRFLFWIARNQRSTVAAGGFFGAVWMGAQGLIPAALGAAIDATIDRHKSGLIDWSLVVLGLGAVQAVAGVLRHRRAVTNFLERPSGSSNW